MKRILFFNLICLTAIGCWAQQGAPYRIIDTTMVFTKEDFTISEDRHGLAYINPRDNSDPSLAYGLAKDANARFPWWMPTFSLNGDEMLASIDDVSCEFSDEVFFASGLHIANGHVISYLETDAPLKNYYVYSRRYDISDYDEEMLKTVHDFQVIASPFRYDSETQTLYLRTKVHIQIRLSYRPKNRYIDEGVVQDQDGNPIPNARVTLLDTITCRTDAEGRYRVVFESRLAYFYGSLKVSAEGFTPFETSVLPSFSDLENEFTRTLAVTLYNAIDLHAGWRQTLLLPAAPDATLGRFFRLKRVVGNKLFFERDFDPQAYVPYVVFPYKDARIDISRLVYDPDTLVRQSIWNFTQERDLIEFEGRFKKAVYAWPRNRVAYPLTIDENGVQQQERLLPMHADLCYDRNYFTSTREAVFIDPEEYVHPFIEDGKQWTVGHYRVGDAKPFRFSEYYFEGDTMVAGRLCKRWMERRYRADGTEENVIEIGALYEDDHCVWRVLPHTDDAQLLYDFSARKGETLEANGNMTLNVEDERYVCYNDKGMHCITVKAIDSDVTSVWIEGVGSVATPLDNEEEPLLGVTHRLISCKVGDETIYEREDDPTDYLADLRDDEYYRPIIETGKQWVVGVWDEGHYVSRKIYSLRRPTVRNRQLIYTLNCAIQDKDSHFAYMTSLAQLQEKERKVWAIKMKDSSDPVMIYDFDAHSGDSISVRGFDDAGSPGQQLRAKVRYNGANVYAQPNGEPLKGYRVTGALLGDAEEEWIAGVGSLSSPLRNFCLVDDMPEERLITCFIGSDTLFYDPVEDERMSRDILELAVPPYRPFIEEGKVWKVGRFPNHMVIARRLDSYYFDGDTIIDSRPCKRLMCLHQTSADYPFEDGGITPWTEYVGALSEAGQRVYCAWPGSEDFHLLYDFASSIGDTVEVESGSYVIAERCAKSDASFKGNQINLAPYGRLIDDWTYEFYYGYNYNTHFSWGEGVGVMCYDPFNYTNGWPNDEYQLMLCTVGDEILFRHPESKLKDGVTPPDDEVKKQRLDFTHVVKPRPKSPSRSRVEEAAAEGAAEPLTGEYSAETLFVDMRDLVGPYTVTLRGDDGTEFYRKEVETSYTLGLSTALARYGQSSLTLTIENAAEQYVATLLLDIENGIVDIYENGIPTTDTEIVNGKSVNGQWYDLSGRRLAVPSLRSQSSSVSSAPSALPKGVYVQRGHKIVLH